jgi:CrcB protein
MVASGKAALLASWLPAPHHVQVKFREVSMVSAIIPFVYVGLGSMLGGMSRYGMTLVTQNYVALALPFGTLISNLAGCLLIGMIAGIGASSQVLSSEMRLLLATGFCGGFTTMSSFVYELGQFIQDKEYFYASSYFVATLAGAGLAFVLGLLLSEWILR